MHFICRLPPYVMKITPCAAVCLLAFFEIHKVLNISLKIAMSLLVAVCLFIGRKKLSLREVLEKRSRRVHFSRHVPPCVMKITLSAAVCLLAFLKFLTYQIFLKEIAVCLLVAECHSIGKNAVHRKLLKKGAALCILVAMCHRVSLKLRRVFF